MELIILACYQLDLRAVWQPLIECVSSEVNMENAGNNSQEWAHYINAIVRGDDSFYKKFEKFSNESNFLDNSHPMFRLFMYGIPPASRIEWQKLLGACLRFDSRKALEIILCNIPEKFSVWSFFVSPKQAINSQAFGIFCKLFIATNPAIRVLNFKGFELDAAMRKELIDAVKCSRGIIEINFIDCPSVRLMKDMFGMLANSKKRIIKSITFKSCYVSPGVAARVKQLLSKKHALRQITVSDIKIKKGKSFNATEFMSAFCTSSKLISLNLDNTKLGDDACKGLFKFLESDKNLKSLSLKNNLIGIGLEAQLMSMLSANTGLTNLDLSDNRLVVSLAKLGEALKLNGTLKRLVLRRCGTLEHFDKLLKQLVNQQALQTLIIDEREHKGISDGSCFAFFLKENPGLNLLDLGKIKLNSAGTQLILMAAEQNTKLKSLKIGSAEFRKEVFATSSPYKCEIESLEFDQILFESHTLFVKFLQFISRLSSLKKLRIGCAVNLDHEDIRSLANFIREKPGLQRIDLGDTKMDADSTAYFTDVIAQCPHIIEAKFHALNGNDQARGNLLKLVSRNNSIVSILSDEISERSTIPIKQKIFQQLALNRAHWLKSRDEATLSDLFFAFLGNSSTSLPRDLSDSICDFLMKLHARLSHTDKGFRKDLEVVSRLNQACNAVIKKRFDGKQDDSESDDDDPKARRLAWSASRVGRARND